MINLLLAVLILLMSTTIPISPQSITNIEMEEIEEVVGENTPEDEKAFKVMQKVYQDNSHYEDMAGVLYMEDFILDIVMRPIEEDPERYLYTSRDGSYLREGELFFSAATNHDEDGIDLNMARIYGHNMASGRKFGMLKRLLHKNNERPLYYFDGEKAVKFMPGRSFKFIDGSVKLERHDLTGKDRIDFITQVSQPYMVEFENMYGVEDDQDILILQTCESAYGLRRDVVFFVEDSIIEAGDFQ